MEKHGIVAREQLTWLEPPQRQGQGLGREE